MSDLSRRLVVEADFWSRQPSGSDIEALCREAIAALAALEAARAEQWRLRRQAEADRDLEKAVSGSLGDELAAAKKVLNIASASMEGDPNNHRIALNEIGRFSDTYR